MIEISDLLEDPDFAQGFTIRRQTGSFTEGDFSTVDTVIPAVGVIQPASSQDVLTFAPEGERQGNWITIYCKQEIRQGDGQDIFSDVIVWQGSYFRVAQAKHWETQGYYRAWARGFAKKE